MAQCDRVSVYACIIDIKCDYIIDSRVQAKQMTLQNWKKQVESEVKAETGAGLVWVLPRNSFQSWGYGNTQQYVKDVVSPFGGAYRVFIPAK